METNNSEEQFKKTVRRKTIRSFVYFFFLILVAITGWKWLTGQPEDNGALSPLRKVMHSNEKLFSSVYSNNHLAPEYPKTSAVKNVRVNGDVGMGEEYDTTGWKLGIVRFSPLVPVSPDTFYVTLDELKKFPKTEVVFNFKCIEGWSQVTWWGGVRFSDFAKHYKIGTRNNTAPDSEHSNEMAAYAGMVTPDEAYYVGVDMQSMMHPQTILCYEMNGKPLPMDQGAPLRLIIPVKYGIKHIKRIGTLYFSDSPPPDYWAEQGYDYYAGL
jgi:hypothetical protein